MTENLKKFLEVVSTNEELQKKLTNASKEEIVAVAAEAGFVLTDADLVQKNELSDDELDTVAGGGRKANCGCGVGGGGTGDESDDTCACVVYGLGYEKNGDCRCHCPIAGVGYDSP